MPASDPSLGPILDIPAPPLTPAGEAIYFSWTTFFKQLISGEYSAIIIRRYRHKGGFTQAINRFRADPRNTAKERALAQKIGIMLVCDKDGNPTHWELRFQREKNEQRKSTTNPEHVRWRARMLAALVDHGRVALKSPIEADAIQWWLYNKLYNQLARTPKQSDTGKKLRKALHQGMLTDPQAWKITQEGEESFTLRISDPLREALQAASS
jgi:hypothetical protein